MKKLVILLLCLSLIGCMKNPLNCYVYYKDLKAVPYTRVNYTPTGLKNMKESNKKYQKEKRAYRRHENKRLRRLYRAQTSPSVTYN